MDHIDTKSLLLDMSNNLSRIGKFGLDGNTKRVMQFLKETEIYASEARKRDLPDVTQKRLHEVLQLLEDFKTKEQFDKYAADDAFTYSSILMHRALVI